METLIAISRWLAKQHVVTWCVQQEGELWCANAFYLFDAQKVAFYILTEEKTRHAQMSGPQAAVAGTVNGQPKTVALIRGVQFKGEIDPDTLFFQRRLVIEGDTELGLYVKNLMDAIELEQMPKALRMMLLQLADFVEAGMKTAPETKQTSVGEPC